MKILAIIAGVVLVAGGTVYFIMNQHADEMEGVEDMMEENEDVMEEFDQSGRGSLSALMAFGQNITCDFTYAPEEGGTTEGTVYIASERMRGDFVMLENGSEYEMHVINDTEYGYTWGKGPEGEMAMKFPVSEDDDSSIHENDRDDSYEPIGMDEDVEYECKRWGVDESKFTPPSDVTFMDFSAQMNQMQQTQFDIQGAQCGACDQLPDAASQAQCKAALGC